ncbi:MAG: DUF3127 domain-containing protein [Cytophagia bacterium]|nr:MAG: DUF3127 domain-containing protein [Cytophagia bacterium]TAG41636.1 MAG: DUF3127 domain-containing protein [Cytophagia bacterium]TAH28336.1 MAG: DUF3127 domain-containing protein [Cytophagales bacterium]
MEIEGRLIKILPEESGTGKTGNSWRKQNFVIETQDQFPKKVCMQMWGDKITQLQNTSIDTLVKVSFDVESREYMEKWYTDVKAWKIEASDGANLVQGGVKDTPSSYSGVDKMPSDPFIDLPVGDAGQDDLPF